MNIAKALAKYDKLKPEEQQLVDEMKAVLDNPNDPRFSVLESAKKMEGCIRNTGIHACGVIITPEDVSNLVPITIAAKDADILVSQFDNSGGKCRTFENGLSWTKDSDHYQRCCKAGQRTSRSDIDPDKIPWMMPKLINYLKKEELLGFSSTKARECKNTCVN
jgi:DNA polymerase-3 subunit alpha